MRGLEKRLAERGLKLAVSDAAFDLLGNVGFDPVYGARPLKRAIQSQLENPLAQQILSGAFVNGDTIEVGNDGDAWSSPRLEPVARLPWLARHQSPGKAQ